MIEGLGRGSRNILVGGVVASSLRAWGGMVNMLALMVEGGCDTSYFSIGDGWVIPRRG